MERADLELVVAVARTGSLTGAARLLHIAQPALSRRLQQLERSVGAPLFDRGRHGAQPTVVGRTLVDRAQDALAAIARAEQDACDVAEGRAGRLRVGTIPTLGAELLPATLAKFRGAHTGVRFELVADGNAERLQQRVANHELDVALTVTTSMAAGVRIAATGEQRFVVVAPSDMALGTRGKVRRKDLVGIPIVAVAAGEGLRLVSDALFAELGEEAVIALETNEREMLVPLVAGGLGVAILPEQFATARAVSGIDVLPLEPAFVRPVGAIVATGPVPALVDEFVAALGFRAVRRARAPRTRR